MLKDVYEKYYFEQNYNCAETILRAGNEYFELGLHDRDMILVGGFGGGIQSGNTCGAILAAVSVLSMKYVEAKAHESADINPIVNMLLDQFKERFGSILCCDIKPQCFKPEVRCQATLIAACEILEKVLLSYNK